MIDRSFRKVRFSPADAATALNLVCGLLSMVMAASGQPVHAVWLIVMSMVFDSVDGNLAKIFNTASDFGREFDSLADMVSFGAAPAFLFAMTLIQPEFSFFAFLAPAAYVVCVAVRLARFNLRPPVRGYFQGLPSPSAALASAMMILVAIDHSWTEWPLFSNVALLFMVTLAFLMLSSIPYPKPFGAEYKRWKPFFILILIAFALTWIVFDREIAFFEMIFFYIFGAPIQFLSLNKKARLVLN